MALNFDFKDAEPHGRTAVELARMQPESGKILVCRINGVLSDLSSRIKRGDVVEFLTFDEKEGKEVFWHSSAHILGYSILNLYPEAKLSSGPATENGFFYDVWIEKPFSEEDYEKIEKEFLRIVEANFDFEKYQMKKEELLSFYAENPYKTHFVREKVKTDESSVYKIGEFVDFCLGPHILSTSFVKSFKVMKNSSTYFLGDATKDALQRIAGVSFPSEAMLKEFLAMREEAEKRDHRKLGLEMDFFFFHPYAAGSAFFLPEGVVIYKNLVEFLQEEYKKRGFEEVVTPNIFSLDLWRESGHLENYRENMFIIEENLGLKPMNCPGHCLMFRHRERTYKELPVRWADFGVLHRNELSGALTGLTRVRRFQQDDAHIFCAMEQIYDEIESCIEFLEHVYAKFGFDFEILLSTRPEKFVGEEAEWNEAEEALKRAVQNRRYRLNEGDGAFYGPKLDVVISDALKRKHQCATIQLDFQLPKRFNLRFKKSDGGYATPVIVHRAIFGSLERMIAIVIENYGHRLPFWLTPRQIAVVPVVAQVSEYVEYFCRKFCEFRIKVFESDDSTFNKRIRNAQIGGYSVIVVIGKKESEEGKVSVRVDNKSEVYGIDELYEMLKWRKTNRLDIPAVEDLKLN